MDASLYLCLYLILMLLGVSAVECGTHNSGEYDVIILGGGMAGVMAARTLVNEGITNFLLLESRAEIGGRIQGQEFGDYNVERGAQWVQLVKEDTANPLFHAAMRYNVSGVYTDYDDLIFYDEEGNNVTEEGMTECGVLDEAFEKMYEYGEKLLADNYRGDISLRGSFRWFGFKPKTPVQMACEYYDIDFETAEQASAVSNRFYVTDVMEDFGDLDYMVTDPRGFSMLPRSLLENEVADWQQKVRMETVVTAVNYTDDQVVVTTDKGSFTGKKAIVTFSLGVLQNSGVQFYPAFPEWKLETIHGFTMADYIHIYVRFSPNILWFVPHDKEWIIYASRRKGYFTVWQNMNKALPGSHMLQAAVTENEARRLQSASDEEVKEEVMAVLKIMFGKDIPDCEEILVPRMYTDHFFQGSYSDWPVGYTSTQHQALQAPVGPVHFAGECYSFHYFGYVHGAMLSGEKTAIEIAACLKDARACAKPYVPRYAAKGCTYRFSINYDPEAHIDDGSCIMVVNPPTSGSIIVQAKYIVTILGLFLFF